MKPINLETHLLGKNLKSNSDRNEFEIKAVYLLECSHPRLAHSIVLRYGFDGLGYKTLEQVGAMLGRINEPLIPLSREQTRRTLDCALRYLRCHWNQKYLNRFFK